MTRPSLPVAAVVAALAPAVLLGPMASPVAAQTPTRHMVDVEGRAVHVSLAGLEAREEAQPVVVFEGGLGSRLGSWGPVLDRVAQFAPVVAYDRPGIGQSEAVSGPVSPRPTAERLHALLAHLEIAPPYVLVGHSWGGALVHYFAGLYPDEVAGVVFIDPTDVRKTEEGHRELMLEAAGEGADTLEAFLEAFEEDFIKQQIANAPPGVRAELEAVNTFRNSDLESRRIPSLPEVPVAVLLSGVDPEEPPEFEALPIDHDAMNEFMRLRRIERYSQSVLNAGEGMLVLAAHATHWIHRDDPDLATEAIRHVTFPLVARRLREALREGDATALTHRYRTLKDYYPPERFDEDLLNELGYELLDAEQIEDAITVFELNVEEYPEEANPYDSLGDAYRAAGRLDEAKQTYERAVTLAEEQGHPNLPTYRTDLEQVTQMLEGKR